MLFLPTDAKEVFIYPKPVSMHWGHDKLRQICKDEMGLDPKVGTVFLFFNKAKDTLKVYFLDDTGDQSTTKKLLRGGFLLPAWDQKQPYIVVAGTKLAALFR